MKVFGVVTLYFPPSEIIENINSYLYGLDGLMIWDNTPEDQGVLFPLNQLDSTKTIIRYRRGRNTGIGQALNEAARCAIRQEYTHLLTMDQDSAFLPGEFGRYLSCIEACKEETYYQFSPTRGKTSSVGNEPVREITDTIISGTITPVSVLERLGLFYEDFVMDAIDTEYALRIRRAGGRIGQVSSVHLTHQVGYPLRKRFLFWHLESFNYSPMRTYYIARNFLYLKRLYPEYDCKYILKLFVLRRLVRIVCIESDKWAKLKALVSGTFQGMRGRLTPDLFYEKMRK